MRRCAGGAEAVALVRLGNSEAARKTLLLVVEWVSRLRFREGRWSLEQ